MSDVWIAQQQYVVEIKATLLERIRILLSGKVKLYYAIPDDQLDTRLILDGKKV